MFDLSKCPESLLIQQLMGFVFCFWFNINSFLQNLQCTKNFNFTFHSTVRKIEIKVYDFFQHKITQIDDSGN